MERLKKIRNIVILLCVVFVIDLVLLASMIRGFTFITWAVIVMQAVVAAYFVAICLGLLKEVREYEDKAEQEKIEKRFKKEG